MLINCPECSHTVSDKAAACPQCGYPISSKTAAAPAVPKPSRTKKYKKLPNGMGCISRLTGKRRKPFAAYPPIKEFALSGNAVRRKAIGYYETYHEAYTALTSFRANPILPSEYTFAHVYEKFIEEKFHDPKSNIEFADSTIKNYKWAYNKCTALYDKPMNTIFKDDMQQIIDGLDMSYSSARSLNSLFTGMFQYSIENGIVTTNYSEFIKIKQKRDYEKGVPFTSEEIKVLWAHKNNINVAIALILIYTGYRISELKIATIDLEGKRFIGGLKTAAGKNRIVPINPRIYELVEQFDQESFSVGNYQDKLFHKTLTSLGFPYAADGKKHTPHDCRHTFSWLADKYKMDDVAKHLIMGHSLGHDVERQHYTHRTFEELYAEMAKITE